MYATNYKDKSKKSIVKKISGHLLDLVIVVVIGNGISFIFSQDFTDFWRRLEIGSLYSLMIGGTLWKGNQFIGYLVSRKIDQHKYPFIALRWNLSLMFIFSLLDILIINYIWYVWIWGWNIDSMFREGYPSMVIELVVTIVITSIFFAIGFFKAWRESAVREERMQKESVILQYNALKNQVNPHFLFNSLNTLTSLVYKDADQSARFIKQLSEVYRYVLEHKDAELVSLGTEIEFCKRYIYLQQIRHGDDLQVVFPESPSTEIRVVPMSIQLLLENAIKHNEVSHEKPLTISIDLNDEYIAVSNDLQPRKTVADSGGIGLDTLIQRYDFLSNRPVQINKSNGRFTVYLPVIKTDQA